jgi:hypothetical protein
MVKFSSLSFQGVQNANLEMDRFVVCSNGHGKGLFVVETFGNVKKCFQSSKWMDGSLKLIWKDQKNVFKSPIWKCQKRFMISRFFF